MATPVEIIFVGLCTFLNVRNETDTKLPQPSAIVHAAPRHDALIAYDHDEVRLSGGETSFALDDPKYHAVRLRRAGEELEITNDPAGNPTVESSFATIAKFPEYSRIPAGSLDWDPDFVPERKQRPRRDRVAAYVTFGGGTLRAEHLTRVKFDFVLNGEPPDQTRAKCYAREGWYTYQTSDEELTIVATSLNREERARRLVFTPLTTGGLVRIWIGASVDFLREIERFEPGQYFPADHFLEYYKTETKPDSVDLSPLPVPVPVYCDGTAVPSAVVISERHSQHARREELFFGPVFHRGHWHRRADPEVGYCGGSQSGCSNCFPPAPLPQ